MKEGKTKAKRIQKIKMWQVSVCIYPTFHIASGPCLLWRTLEACICYSYRTLSAWVQWKPSGSASQMGFKRMFASWLLSLGSFSHWLLKWRLLLFGGGIDTSSLKGIWSFHGTETIKRVQWGSSKLFRESQMCGSTWSPQVLQYEQAFKNFHKSKGSAQCERNGGNKRNRKLEEDGHAQEGTLDSKLRSISPNV